ncbi:MAG: bifunctional diaminohydroxyphosphoribosylaminopyrimidine deaminase/5-amino-6-(5-phosphoribosylamino)uracil reductase RibD [Deltaproteobacteria bacterium]|nr:MAG: bifunctional diaminohydroxyphosphoribosylaminopyrimidine deaminase/5-amino-6-(5-phosphoribosylamino)uracil reductase RibD [Deltaproteobacteria bacterium]
MSGASWSDSDKRYLRVACRLARRAAGRTSPNPIVGAVLVRGGRIVGTGFHRFAGGDHAEIVALKHAGPKARGATLYITLEPCNHYGRTPPCTQALIRAGIKEVVCGTRDPNPLVAGQGFRRLRRAGIKVRVGVLENDCRALIESFAKFITRRLPFVTLKLAATLDGKIAAANGDAHWISGEDSRQIVHRMRNAVDAVVVGVGTVKADDPQLTCRIPRGRNPWRIVLDSRLSIPLSARILRQVDPAKTIVATGTRVSAAKTRAIEALGAQVWPLPLKRGKVAWRPLLRKLAASGVVTVMIEGGAGIAASAVKEKIVDKIIFFYAPKILGGDGWAMIERLGIRRVKQSVPVKNLHAMNSGGDLMVTGYL